MKVGQKHPAPHARYLVIREGIVFTATPCYGLHQPWWVVKTMDGEADPVSMNDEDEWALLSDILGPFERIVNRTLGDDHVDSSVQ
jgi:hypothetical protein